MMKGKDGERTGIYPYSDRYDTFVLMDDIIGYSVLSCLLMLSSSFQIRQG